MKSVLTTTIKFIEKTSQHRLGRPAFVDMQLDEARHSLPDGKVAHVKATIGDKNTNTMIVDDKMAVKFRFFFVVSSHRTMQFFFNFC